MTYHILKDEDVARLLSMEEAIHTIEDAFREKAEGTLVAPPRFHVSVEKGSLVFTAGAATKREKVIGFRVYDTFPHASTNTEQLVVVFDSESGALKGIVIGGLIGAMRTGAIGGVAIKHMSRPDSRVLGILGSGRQARTQLEAASTIRHFERVKVYSPTRHHREAFAQEMGARLDLDIEPAASARAVVHDADVLICATTSSAPVFDPDWLKPGVHINSVGPKFKEAHELPVEAATQSRVIATDSPAQIEAYPNPFFLTGTPAMQRIIDLSEIVVGKRVGRTAPDDITLFCSVGLAGTEVVVANAAIERAG
ncbi:MAG: ornithine cyclodeaminase family protein [Chloroflexota bacterium]|nr:ornithine cyclodeaminase family protein [Chloroflexota bacterium]